MATAEHRDARPSPSTSAAGRFGQREHLAARSMSSLPWLISHQLAPGTAWCTMQVGVQSGGAEGACKRSKTKKKKKRSKTGSGEVLREGLGARW